MRHPFASLRDEYAQLWRGMAIDAAVLPVAEVAAGRLARNIARYRAVAARTRVPPVVIAAIHHRESAANFRRHLHNGDPLERKTTHVPAGRPLGDPPWTWEDSAADALGIDGLSAVRDWSIERALFQLELYNGFGPRNRGIHTGYLWAGTNHYRRGKYVADGKWDGTHVDKQLGCAVLIRCLIDRDGSLALPGMPAETPASMPGVPAPAPAPQRAPVGVGGGVAVRGTASLQETLNRLGAEPPLRVDGSYGRHTRRAVEDFQRAQNLQADGLAGPKTLAALDLALAQASRKNGPAVPAGASRPPRPAPETAPARSAGKPPQRNTSMDIVWQLARYALIAGGTTLVTKGLLTEEQLHAVVGAILALGAAGWGVFVKSGTKAVPAAVAARPEVPTVSAATGRLETASD